MKKTKMRLYVDQYGDKIIASTVKELKEKSGPGRVYKMFIDSADGKTYHTGYVIGQLWYTMYEPVRNEVIK